MIAMLGDGSWATGLMHILAEQNGQRAIWWVRDPERLQEIQPTSRMRVGTDITKVIEDADDIFVVIPSAFLQDSLSPITPEMLKDKNIISAVKGFLPSLNITVSQFFEQHYNVPPDRIAIVSGPSHAEEVAQSMLTYLTVASPNEELAERVRNMLDCEFICTCYSPDVVGIECAAVLKNVYAVAAGICHALGYGDNLQAVLVAAELYELSHFLEAYSHSEEQREVSAYVYLSDLLATCYSTHSRNRTLGELLGRGYSAKQARLMQKMVAEGYYAVNAVKSIADEKQIDMPIAMALYDVLYNGVSVKRSFNQLVRHLVNPVRQ